MSVEYAWLFTSDLSLLPMVKSTCVWCSWNLQQSQSINFSPRLALFCISVYLIELVMWCAFILCAHRCHNTELVDWLLLIKAMPYLQIIVTITILHNLTCWSNTSQLIDFFNSKTNSVSFFTSLSSNFILGTLSGLQRGTGHRHPCILTGERTVENERLLFINAASKPAGLSTMKSQQSENVDVSFDSRTFHFSVYYLSIWKV